MILAITLGITLLIVYFHLRRIPKIYNENGDRLSFGNWYDFLFSVFGNEVNPFDDATGLPPVSGHTPFFTPVVLLTRSEDVKKFLYGIDFKEKKAMLPPPFDRLFSKSLIFSFGERWTRQRKTLNSAFTSSMVKEIQPIFDSATTEFIELIGDGGWFEVEDLFERFTFDVIGRAGFSYDYGAMRDADNSMFRDAKLSFTSLVLANTLSSLNPFSKKGNELKAAAARTVEMMNRMIEERRERDERVDILDHILDLEDEEVMNNVFLFFLAGAETTVSALISTIYFIVKEDLQSRIETEGRDFLLNVLYESLRMRPPVRMVSTRSTCREVELGGWRVPAGVKVSASIDGLNRGEEWERPFEFDPDRWNEDNGNRLKFITFSWGPRVCIGKKFAINEMLTLLERVLSKYTLSLEDGFEPVNRKNLVTQRPVGGMRVLFERK